jgi:phosphoglycolate phosphatase
MTSPRAVIFDFDFTLGDSSRGVVDCVSLALADLGLPTPSQARIVKTIGLPLEETFRELTGDRDDGAATAFSKRFHHHADRLMEANTVVYPNVDLVMRHLRNCGISLGIVSTKYRERIARILATAGVRRHFDVIVGAGDVVEPKPHPEGIIMAVARLDATSETAVYVGDHPVDALAADAAGVRFVAILSGTCSRGVFDEYPHDEIIEGLVQLPEVLGV